MISGIKIARVEKIVHNKSLECEKSTILKATEGDKKGFEVVIISDVQFCLKLLLPFSLGTNTGMLFLTFLDGMLDLNPNIIVSCHRHKCLSSN